MIDSDNRFHPDKDIISPVFKLQTDLRRTLEGNADYQHGQVSLGDPELGEEPEEWRSFNSAGQSWVARSIQTPTMTHLELGAQTPEGLKLVQVETGTNKLLVPDRVVAISPQWQKPEVNSPLAHQLAGELLAALQPPQA